MIPRRLRIRNFLSYRDCEVDLTGLQLAVLCGPNGNGKSALLDAMTWALWGEARGRLEDDRIHLGEHDMLVDFEFESSGDLFQVVRKRTRGRPRGPSTSCSSSPKGRTPLTGSSVSETQAEIVRKLRMDYDTFVNSAFIAQGRANEFTKKRPAERKEVFRNVLGLERYQEIAEAATERRKNTAAALKELERNMGEAAGEVQHLPALRAELARQPASARRWSRSFAGSRGRSSSSARLPPTMRAWNGKDWKRSDGRVAPRDGRAAGGGSCQARGRARDGGGATFAGGDIRRAHVLLEQLREEEQAMATLQQQGLALQAAIADADRRISVERARIETDLAGSQKAVEAAEGRQRHSPGSWKSSRRSQHSSQTCNGWLRSPRRWRRRPRSFAPALLATAKRRTRRRARIPH
jgi:exonuclease SbcC